MLLAIPLPRVSRHHISGRTRQPSRIMAKSRKAGQGLKKIPENAASIVQPWSSSEEQETGRYRLADSSSSGLEEASGAGKRPGRSIWSPYLGS